MSDQGTPKNLDELIYREIAIARSMSSLHEALYCAIREFLSDKVGVAFLVADKDEAARIQALFELMVERDEGMKL